MQVPTKVFISYSWDSDNHKQWVRLLAERLDSYSEIQVVWDGFDLDPFDDKNLFMEQAVHNSDLVLVVATKNYKNKADSRTGGVGIETYLATSKHWASANGGKSSPIVVLLREPDATPNYLLGKIYLDFSAAEVAEKNFQQLLHLIKGNLKVARPPKSQSLSNTASLLNFTRAEDLLKVIYSKRTAIIVDGPATDWAQRIKFQLWAVHAPQTAYFLFLFPNITISQTIARFCQEVANRKLDIRDLTILRPERGDDTLVPRLLKEGGFTAPVIEMSFADYVWEYLVAEELKTDGRIYKLPYYTEQPVYLTSVDGKQIEEEDAASTLYAALLDTSSTSTHLVIGVGGMGKSSLCLEIANRLQESNDGKTRVTLIQAETIRELASQSQIAGTRIDSIYDLYQFTSQIVGSKVIYTKQIFELAVLCGTLCVIVDGLDEFVSIFREQFDIERFLASTEDLHGQLGRSRILITSRSNPLPTDFQPEEHRIRRYDLLGFKEAGYMRYFKRRFAKLTSGATVIDQLQRSVAELVAYEGNGRVIPFFVDVVATMYESRDAQGDPGRFMLSKDQRGYESNARLVDLIIFSIFAREQERHRISLAVAEQIDLLAELVAETGQVPHPTSLKERLQLYFDERGDKLYEEIIINPLFMQAPDGIRFRYDFLTDYFVALYVIRGIVRKSSDAVLLKCLSTRILPGSSCAKDVQLYFSNKQAVLIDSIKSLAEATSKLSRQVPADSDLHRKAMGSTLSLLASMTQWPRDRLSEEVRFIYGAPRDLAAPGKIDGLYVFGDFPPLDFSNLEIWNSKFVRYTGFSGSKLTNAKFLYCEFVDMSADRVPDTFTPQVFDSTCNIGHLDGLVQSFEKSAASERATTESELKKFLRNFFRYSTFVDKTVDHIQFSSKIEGLKERNFDRLVKMGLFQLSTKVKGKWYEITPHFQESVHRFLTNNLVDDKIDDVLQAIGSKRSRESQ